MRVHYTVDFERQQVGCTVVPKPFFDPERKKSTPGAKAAGKGSAA